MSGDRLSFRRDQRGGPRVTTEKTLKKWYILRPAASARPTARPFRATARGASLAAWASSATLPRRLEVVARAQKPDPRDAFATGSRVIGLSRGGYPGPTQKNGALLPGPLPWTSRPSVFTRAPSPEGKSDINAEQVAAVPKRRGFNPGRMESSGGTRKEGSLKRAVSCPRRRASRLGRASYGYGFPLSRKWQEGMVIERRYVAIGAQAHICPAAVACDLPCMSAASVRFRLGGRRAGG
jgi:hypothetical protein